MGHKTKGAFHAPSLRTPLAHSSAHPLDGDHSDRLQLLPVNRRPRLFFYRSHSELLRDSLVLVYTVRQSIIINFGRLISALFVRNLLIGYRIRPPYSPRDRTQKSHVVKQGQQVVLYIVYSTTQTYMYYKKQ